MGVANWEWYALPVYTLFIVFFAPLFLRTRLTTVPEYFARRFGPLCSDIYSWIMLLAYVFVFMVPVLYGGSLAFLRTDRLELLSRALGHGDRDRRATRPRAGCRRSCGPTPCNA